MLPDKKTKLTPIIRRLKLAEYMAQTNDENGEPVSANWVAKKVGSTHNTIMYYKEHYKNNLADGKIIRQPSHSLVKALLLLFDTKEEDFIEWDVSPERVVEGDDYPPKMMGMAALAV